MVCKGTKGAGLGFVTWAFSFVEAQVGAPTYTDLMQRDYAPLAREDPTRSRTCCLILVLVWNLLGSGLKLGFGAYSKGLFELRFVRASRGRASAL